MTLIWRYPWVGGFGVLGKKIHGTCDLFCMMKLVGVSIEVERDLIIAPFNYRNMTLSQVTGQCNNTSMQQVADLCRNPIRSYQCHCQTLYLDSYNAAYGGIGSRCPSRNEQHEKHLAQYFFLEHPLPFQFFTAMSNSGMLSPMFRDTSFEFLSGTDLKERERVKSPQNWNISEKGDTRCQSKIFYSAQTAQFQHES